MSMFRRSVLITCLVLGVLAISPMASAQEKTIHWIVPAPPGGALDLAGRLIAKKIKERTGQTVIVENRPGGGGAVAGEYILSSNRPGSLYVLEATQTMAGVLDQMIPGLKATIEAAGITPDE